MIRFVCKVVNWADCGPDGGANAQVTYRTFESSEIDAMEKLLRQSGQYMNITLVGCELCAALGAEKAAQTSAASALQAQPAMTKGEG